MITGVGAAFLQSILPVLLIGGLGYLVGRARAIDLTPITSLTVLVLVPAIVFDSLARAALPRDLPLTPRPARRPAPGARLGGGGALDRRQRGHADGAARAPDD